MWDRSNAILAPLLGAPVLSPTPEVFAALRPPATLYHPSGMQTETTSPRYRAIETGRLPGGSNGQDFRFAIVADGAAGPFHPRREVLAEEQTKRLAGRPLKLQSHGRGGVAVDAQGNRFHSRFGSARSVITERGRRG